MASATQSLIRSVLQESGPLTFNDLVAQCTAREPTISRNPKQTIRNALTSDDFVERTADGRYAYLPAIATGAGVRLPVIEALGGGGRLAAGCEVIALLLQQTAGSEPGPPRAIALAGGPTVTAGLERGRALAAGRAAAMTYPLVLPPPFWEWWATQRRAGADEIVIRCEDGVAGRYTATPLSSTSLERDAVAARNAQVRVAAAAALRQTGGCLRSTSAGGCSAAASITATRRPIRSPLPSSSPPDRS